MGGTPASAHRLSCCDLVKHTTIRLRLLEGCEVLYEGPPEACHEAGRPPGGTPGAKSEDPTGSGCPQDHATHVESAADDDTGDDGDGELLASRGAGRNLTVGTCTPSERVDCSSCRSERRTQSMPQLTRDPRRSDSWTPSREFRRELTAMSQALYTRRRRGSPAGIPCEATVPEDTLYETWRAMAHCHVHGVHTDGQAHGDQRERWYADGQLMPGSLPPVISCQKGSKGFGDKSPNQDNFSITYFKSGHTLACAFDGHGPRGHDVSGRAVQTVPFFFAHSEQLAKGDVQGALVHAFESAHDEVVLSALEEGWDVQASGTTAVAAVWKDGTVWIANCGDSRCIIGSERNRTLLFESKDHKPEDAEERARIEAAGGDIRTETHPDGFVSRRVFVKERNYPGLCMSRTLGDKAVKDCGVIPTPDTYEYTLEVVDEPFIILASDGIWEFLDSAPVVKAVAAIVETERAENAMTWLHREARKRWNEEEEDYCDDIMSILIRLKS